MTKYSCPAPVQDMAFTQPELYIFAISHFSEKIRFILDYAGYQYSPVYLMPGEHIAVVQQFAPESHVPVLRKSETGEIHQGSNNIIQYLIDSGKLELENEEEQLHYIKLIDEGIGYPLQNIIYSYLLEHPEVIAPLFITKPGDVATIDNPTLLKVGLKRRYKINTRSVSENKERFDQTVKELSNAYEQSDYLSGNTIGPADMTAASLISPLIFSELPDHPTASWFSHVQYPEALQQWIDSYRDSAYFQKAREIYKFRRQQP